MSAGVLDERMPTGDGPYGWRERLDDESQRWSAFQADVRRRLHALPEPSGEEFHTTQFLVECLRSQGFSVRPAPGGRGLFADFHAGMSDGVDVATLPCIALRADIDALRIQDAKMAEYRSTCPGVMHACGHDGHTAVVMGALLALRGVAEVLPWPVRCRAIFQPEEETAVGATAMMEAGALEGVSAILSVHMDPMREVGRVGMRSGALTANCDDLHIRVNGRGGHAARPHESRDPIAAAAQLLGAIYQWVPRSMDSHDPAVVTVGQIRAGDNANVIPESAELWGTIRTLSPEARQQTRRQLEQLARGVGEISGTRITVTTRAGAPSVINDERLVSLLRLVAAEVVGEGQIDAIKRPSMGGEDFAYYLERVPGAMFRLGCGRPGMANEPLHSPLFDLEERSLPLGARILAGAVVRWSEPGSAWPGR